MASLYKKFNQKLVNYINELEGFGFLPDNWLWHKKKVQQLKEIDESLIKNLTRLHKQHQDIPEFFETLMPLLNKLHQDLQKMLKSLPSAELQKKEAEIINQMIVLIKDILKKGKEKIDKERLKQSRIRKIAIDIVILPPRDIMNQCIKLNNKIKRTRIVLNNKDCYPHISLVMGVMKIEEKEKIVQKLREILSKFKPLKLTITKAYFRGYAGLKIKKIPEIQQLHERILNGLSEFLEYDIELKMLYKSKPERVPPVTIPYVKSFKSKHSFDKYKPHITLGFGLTLFGGKIDIDLPLTFIASEIALCQLGNYCTCRRKIASINLSS